MHIPRYNTIPNDFIIINIIIITILFSISTVHEYHIT